MNAQSHLVLRLARIKAPEDPGQKSQALNFVFSKGGNGKFVSKWATHPVLPGQVLVFEGAEGSKLAPLDENGEFLFWTFSVCFENLLPLFDGNEISQLHRVTEGFKGAKTYPANSALALECRRLLEEVPPQFDLNHRGQLIRIAAAVLSEEFKGALSHGSNHARPADQDRMVQVFEKLSAAEIINLSVGELADKFNCSRRHLNRLFHQHFGVSVAALRMEMRLLKAISLLRDANAKVINVAEQCGFNHLGLFNTCFKRRFGTSPGQWRKSTVKAASGLARKIDKSEACPLFTAGKCPVAAESAATAHTVASTLAGKIIDGSDIMEDLKRRDLLFGSQSLSHPESQMPDARP